MTAQQRPRRDTVDALIKLMMNAITTPEGEALESTTGELATAIFSLCGRMVQLSLATANPGVLAVNIETSRTAIAALYALLPAATVN